MVVDIIAFYRPRLPGLNGKDYDAPAGKALPAGLIGLVGMTGSLNGQHLAVPRETLRVSADDAGEAGRKQALLRKVARKLGRDEAAVPDAGFRLREVPAAGVQGDMVRLPRNFTARRNAGAPYAGQGPPPK